ncbi:DUF424 domain-containing protein [Halobacterium litoreum]|uniref:DUF424 domain-containing protein n=1 Tax=Halobacterium litoreum TaxID=2039234 RepID=A0ABD5NEX5_9EURY|nr:DUF424 family protein [Halobacterium litoreum]UHH13320.1 DUF424 family protein [Halobacterium litoreum]
MILTERETERGVLVTACDPDVLGETFENGEVEFTVNEEFYGGDEADADAVRAALARANVANIVGDDAVGIAIEEGFVEEANVLDLDGTVHAQFMRL